MDAEEAAKLASSLEKALTDALVTADATRGERAAAEKKAEAESAEAKRIAEKRSEALRCIIDSFERGRKDSRNAAMSAVAGYCDKVRTDVLKSLKADRRMPRMINYLERYSALVGMDGRSDVLERLDSTLSLADDILDATGGVDARGALKDAADTYAQGIMHLDGIRIAEADRMPEGEEPDAELPGFATPTPSEIIRVMEAAFAGVLGDLPEVEVRKIEEVEAAKGREKLVGEQIAAAAEAAVRAAEVIVRARAVSVAGAVLAVGQPVGFDGDIEPRLAMDPSRVRELSAEVHKSFGVFKRVVADNGLFAAFASDGSYGACRGARFDWWWEGFFDDEYFGEKPGRKAYGDIPTNVEEDEGGDALEKSIKRMREFNERKYWGLLDDDFSQHVDAFWYGFKKLMESVNGLFELDLRAFGGYCNQISRTVQSSAGDLGERMDDSQLSAFCKEINDRARTR